MKEYIIELSKYGISLLVILYTISCFFAFRKKNEKQSGLYVIQSLLLFAMQLLFFLDLTFVSGEMQYVFFYVFVMVPMIYEDIHTPILNMMCMLL